MFLHGLGEELAHLHIRRNEPARALKREREREQERERARQVADTWSKDKKLFCAKIRVEHVGSHTMERTARSAFHVATSSAENGLATGTSESTVDVGDRGVELATATATRLPAAESDGEDMTSADA